MNYEILTISAVVSYVRRLVLIVSDSSSEMRPPVETPSMNSPRLQTWNMPVKQVETLRISSLSKGLVPFMVGQSAVALAFQLPV